MSQNLFVVSSFCAKKNGFAVIGKPESIFIIYERGFSCRFVFCTISTLFPLVAKGLQVLLLFEIGTSAFLVILAFGGFFFSTAF